MDQLAFRVRVLPAQPLGQQDDQASDRLGRHELSRRRNGRYHIREAVYDKLQRVGFGFHVTEFSTRLSGTGTVGGATASFQSEGHDVLAPLPTIGLFGTYRFTDQLSLRGRVDYLSLKVGDYDGKLTNALAALDWRFTKNVGAGVGFRYVKYNLNVTKSDFHGEIDYRFQGPTFFLNVGF